MLKEDIADGKWNNLPKEELIKKFNELMSPTPHVFNLETTNFCNMKCVMCPRTTKMKRPVQWFPKELYPRILDQINPYPEDKLKEFFAYIKNKYGVGTQGFSENAFYFFISSKCLTLHGYGEPILDPYIIEVVSMCSQRGIPTYLSTVPANIKIEKIKELMKAGLNFIKFSIDALSDAEAKNIRGQMNDFTGSFAKIEEVIEHRNNNPKISTQIVVTMISLSKNKEQEQIEEQFLDLWKEKDVLCYIKSQDNRWLYENDEKPEEVDVCTKEYCEYPWTSMTIMADGSVVPCTQDYDCEMVMGNINDQTLQEIWNSDKYRKFREMHITGQFPKNFKCADRCDQILVADRLKGIRRTCRVI